MGPGFVNGWTVCACFGQLKGGRVSRSQGVQEYTYGRQRPGAFRCGYIRTKRYARHFSPSITTLTRQRQFGKPDRMGKRVNQLYLLLRSRALHIAARASNDRAPPETNVRRRKNGMKRQTTPPQSSTSPTSRGPRTERRRALNAPHTKHSPASLPPPPRA